MLHKAPRCRGVFIVLCSVFTFLTLGFTFPAHEFVSPGQAAVDIPSVSSYRELRYTGVFGQRSWATCGPAAVATLLHFYYEVDVDEVSVLRRVMDGMSDEGHDVSYGISALALVRAFEGYGFTTIGYRLTPEDLMEYFYQGGLPVILHVTVPQQHYVVAVGLIGDAIVVADPSWGRRIEPLHDFVTEKGFSGVTLVPLPRSEHKLSIGQGHQQDTLEWASRRLLRLGGGRGIGR